MTECKHQIDLLSAGICCKAYFKSIRPDGRGWMHFPNCSESNCPLIHPELFEGAILIEEDSEDETLDR